MNRLLALAAAMAIAFGGAASVKAEADGSHAAKGRSWALLIGVEKYHRVPALRYTVNDVRQLALTLHTRAGFSEDCILEITDQAPSSRYRPLKASIEAELPAWLKQPGPDDSIIVYFSGHGFRDASGKMYLAPIDGNPEDLVNSAISVEWFRQQLAECKAHFKLLILDSCHAGLVTSAPSKRTASIPALRKASATQADSQPE